MKRDVTCPDFSLLSQFLDCALGGDQTRQISQHLETCSACRSQVAQLRRMEGALRTEFNNSLAPHATLGRSPKCLSPMQVVAYVHRALSPTEQQRCEQHFYTCDACLKEVVDTVNMMASLPSTTDEPLPVALAAQVSAQWKATPRSLLSRLVIRIAQQSAQLLETHIVAPLLQVQQLGAPQLAFRSEDTDAALQLELVAKQAILRMVIVRADSGLALKILLLDSTDQPFVNKRVYVRREGKVVFSAKTNKTGILQIPRLQTQLYELECPELTLTFQLELRP